MEAPNPYFDSINSSRVLVRHRQAQKCLQINPKPYHGLITKTVYCTDPYALSGTGSATLRKTVASQMMPVAPTAVD